MSKTRCEALSVIPSEELTELSRGITCATEVDVYPDISCLLVQDYQPKPQENPSEDGQARTSVV